MEKLTKLLHRVRKKLINLQIYYFFKDKLIILINRYMVFKSKNPGLRGILKIVGRFFGYLHFLGFNLWLERKAIRIDDDNSDLITDIDDVAVHIHVYYEELSDEIIEYLINIPLEFHLYITTDTEKKLLILKEKFLKLKNLKSAQFLVVPNKGRNIAPMLVSLGKELAEHEIVLHIHTKKSPHNHELIGWRRYLLKSLLGNSSRIKSILNEFYKDKNLGILFPVPFYPIRQYLATNNVNLKTNYPHMEKLFKREGKNKKVKFQYLQFFPTGTMFWFRGNAVRSLVNMGLSYDDFEEEMSQVDGTLAHGIERMFVYFAESMHLSSKAYSTRDHDLNYEMLNIKALELYISDQIIINPVLIFDHGYGGGSNAYTDILVDKILNEGNQVIKVTFKSEYKNLQGKKCPLWCIQWHKAANNSIFFATNEITHLFKVILKASPSKVIVNSLYGYPDVDIVIDKIIELKRLSSTQLEIKAHDFHALCPSPHLLNLRNEYCGVPLDERECNKCLKKISIKWRIPGTWWPENISKWRSAFSRLLKETTTIEFFDSSAINNYKKVFIFSDERVSITPHNDEYFNVPSYANLSGKLHLGVLGNLTVVKGLLIVDALASYIKTKGLDIPITLVGSTHTHLNKNIRVTGRYEISELYKLISDCKINIVFIASIVPETFCYTLSEAMKMRLPVICFDIGAQGHRVKNYDLGKALPLNSTMEEILLAAKSILKVAKIKT